MKNISKKLGTALSIALFTFCYSYNVLAAPGTLAQAPLFLKSAVDPNIFFTYDDSGSMDWGLIVKDGTAGFSGVSGYPFVRSFGIAYYSPPWHEDSHYNVLPPNDLVPGTWVFRNHNGNKNYYNPDVEYKPWPGSYPDGSTAPEAEDYTEEPGHDFTVKKYPYNRSDNDTLDLTERFDYLLYKPGNHKKKQATEHKNSFYIPTYYIWPDTESDGVIETTDNKTEVEITPANAPFTSPVKSIVRTYSEELANFANWFVYYRKRAFSAKAGMGAVINSAESVRMGMEALNGGLILNLQSMDDVTNKYNLLKDFYTRKTSGATPVRKALKRVGDRFKNTTDGSVILSQADGGACQQNFNIVMTDGFWNGNSAGVGNADKSASADYGFDGSASESNDGGNYEDSWSDTVADVAMHYYETDLSSLPNQVPVPAANYVTGAKKADHQHLVTYTIGFGLDGTLDPNVEPTDPLFAGWPNPIDVEDEERVDDLRHAAYNSRGLYLSADDPQELAASLEAAISDIGAQTATASAAAATSGQLTGGSNVFFAKFNTDGWQGTIDSYGLDEDSTTGLFTLKATGVKSAANKLASRTDSRVILTNNSDGVEFKWTNLTGDMKADLNTGPDGTPDGKGMDRLAYIEGDHSKEGAGNDDFRQRATLTNGKISRLGDIIHSGPAYVGLPDIGWPDKFPVNNPSTPYSEFVADYETGAKTRKSMIYVGANDGMLHGFESVDLVEELAYIPSNLFSANPDEGLHYLTEQDYAHRYYVDLTPSVSDVYINGSWRTILIGGQRAGGKGYFALDITDPGSFSATNAADIVMWEFTHPDLGYTYSQPQIGMMNDGTWVAIFGNGYNNDGSGKAELFIVDIEGGMDGTWDSNDYVKISTGVGSASNPNGLATPALADLDQNGTIDRAYAGDLEGNMWAFDLSGNTSATWDLAYSTSPFFTTGGANEPITSKPTLSFHPSVRTIKAPPSDVNEPNVMVYFGSGQYLVESDIDVPLDVSGAAITQNYFYGVWDKGNANRIRRDLVEQTISTFTYLSEEYRFLSKNPVDYSSSISTDFGWKIRLPDTGERIITSPVVRGEVLYFSSSVPTNSPCGTGGYGWWHAVDLASGGAPNSPVHDINDDGDVNASDVITGHDNVSGGRLEDPHNGTTMTPNDVIRGGPENGIDRLPDRPFPPQGRFSWQELLQ